MNERIRQCADGAGLDSNWKPGFDSIYGQQLEKFAKLIIEECGDVAYRAFWDNPETVRGIHIKQKIKEHFGVE